MPNNPSKLAVGLVVDASSGAFKSAEIQAEPGLGSWDWGCVIELVVCWVSFASMTMAPWPWASPVVVPHSVTVRFKAVCAEIRPWLLWGPSLVSPSLKWHLTRHLLQGIWQMLELESLTRCCNAQSPQLCYTGAFFPSGPLGLPTVTMCLDSTFLSLTS